MVKWIWRRRQGTNQAHETGKTPSTSSTNLLFSINKMGMKEESQWTKRRRRIKRGERKMKKIIHKAIYILLLFSPFALALATIYIVAPPIFPPLNQIEIIIYISTHTTSREPYFSSILKALFWLFHIIYIWLSTPFHSPWLWLFNSYRFHLIFTFHNT